jgi:hypothetical protein
MLRLLMKLAGAAAAVFLGWVILVSLAPGNLVASGAPCPRNLAWGPAWLPRVSPLVALRIALPDGGKAKLCYGQPSLKGRKMLGGVVPYGELWRLGANEPTTLHVNRTVHIGDIVLAPGSYSLYAIPGPIEWEIIVNRSTRQWGLESEYTSSVQAKEIGRIRVKAQHPDSPVEALTFTSVPSALGAVEIVFEWQDVRWRLPIAPGAENVDPFESTTPTTDM